MFKYLIGGIAAISVICMAETAVAEWAMDKRAKRNAMMVEANARAEAIRKGDKEVK